MMSRLGLLFITVVLIGCRAPAGTATPASQLSQPIRVVSHNIFKCQGGEDAIVNQLRALDPDIICLQEVRVEDAAVLAERLQMNYVFQAHRNYPNEGIAIYSRAALIQPQPVMDPDGRACALFADIEVGGVSFTIVSVHLVATQRARDLLRSDSMRGREIEMNQLTWIDRGHKPVILGGDFNQLPMGRNYAIMTRSFVDALRSIGKTGATLEAGRLGARVDYLLHGGGWTIDGGGVGDRGGSDHRLIWIDARLSP